MNLSLDAYTLRARLAPIVLAAGPAISFALAGGFSLDATTTVVALLAAAIALALCGLARDLGFKLQDDLWESWGGSPTLQRLRWSSSNDHESLARLHADIEAVTGQTMPSRDSEKTDPESADAIYVQATTVLRGLTENHQQFKRLFSENMEYGFRRNCLGLRPFGLVVAAAGVITSIVLFSSPSTDSEIAPSVWIGPGVASLAFFLYWAFIVKSEWVRKPAESYADRLVEAASTMVARSTGPTAR